MKHTSKLLTAAALATLFLQPGTAKAGLLGEVFRGFVTGDVTNQPAGAPTSTFAATDINYGTDSTTLLTDWLNHNGQNDGASLNPSSAGAFQINNTYLRFTGFLTLSAGVHTLQLDSDDGSQLYLNGSLIVDDNGSHGPTIVSNTFDAGAGGTFAITLLYDENSGGTADLLAQDCTGGACVDLAGAELSLPLPEPGALALFGVGLAGIGLMRRRRA